MELNRQRTNRNFTQPPKIKGKVKSAQNSRLNNTSKTIYIGNLSYNKDAKAIKYMFSEFGQVKSLEIVTMPGTEKSKGYAFVKMSNRIQALKAVSLLNGKVVDGRTLKVSIALEQDRFTKDYKKYDSSKFSTNKKINNKKRDGDNEEHPKRTPRKKKGLGILLDHLASR